MLFAGVACLSSVIVVGFVCWCWSCVLCVCFVVGDDVFCCGLLFVVSVVVYVWLIVVRSRRGVLLLVVGVVVVAGVM